MEFPIFYYHTRKERPLLLLLLLLREDMGFLKGRPIWKRCIVLWAQGDSTDVTTAAARFLASAAVRIWKVRVCEKTSSRKEKCRVVIGPHLAAYF